MMAIRINWIGDIDDEVEADNKLILFSGDYMIQKCLGHLWQIILKITSQFSIQTKESPKNCRWRKR